MGIQTSSVITIPPALGLKRLAFSNGTTHRQFPCMFVYAIEKLGDVDVAFVYDFYPREKDERIGIYYAIGHPMCKTVMIFANRQRLNEFKAWMGNYCIQQLDMSMHLQGQTLRWFSDLHEDVRQVALREIRHILNQSRSNDIDSKTRSI